MKYSDFVKWVDVHTPADTDNEAFKDYLAMIGASILENASKNTGKTIDELIEFHFSSDGNLSQ